MTHLKRYMFWQRSEHLVLWVHFHSLQVYLGPHMKFCDPGQTEDTCTTGRCNPTFHARLWWASMREEGRRALALGKCLWHTHRPGWDALELAPWAAAPPVLDPVFLVPISETCLRTQAGRRCSSCWQKLVWSQMSCKVEQFVSRGKGHTFRANVFLLGRIPGQVSVLAKGTPPSGLWQGCFERLGWSGEWEPGASSSRLGTRLDLPKLFVFLHFLICKMGLIRLGEVERRGVVWIHKFTLRRLFEDVKLSKGLEVL